MADRYRYDNVPGAPMDPNWGKPEQPNRDPALPKCRGCGKENEYQIDGYLCKECELTREWRKGSDGDRKTPVMPIPLPAPDAEDSEPDSAFPDMVDQAPFFAGYEPGMAGGFQFGCVFSFSERIERHDA